MYKRQIIDVICKVDDDFLKKNNLEKSTMKLVDQNESHFDFDYANNLSKRIGEHLLIGWESQPEEKKSDFYLWNKKNPWVEDYWTNDEETTLAIHMANFESRVGSLLRSSETARNNNHSPLNIIFSVTVPKGKETLDSKREKVFSTFIPSESSIAEM